MFKNKEIRIAIGESQKKKWFDLVNDEIWRVRVLVLLLFNLLSI
jgi:hypothetical protein